MKGFTLEFEIHETGQVGGFYRYRFGETQFWFDQKPNGDIYAVSIRNEKYPQIDFYADNTENQYYPDRVRFHMPHVEIKSHKDEIKYNKMFQYLCEVRSELQRFFESSEHVILYWENHKWNNNE